MTKTLKLYELSTVGTGTIAISDALSYPKRARAVELGPKDDPNDLKKLTRIYRVKLVVNEGVPAIVGTLAHLRSLTITGQGLRSVPPEIFALPRLEWLFLEYTDLEDLEGLELSRSLTTVIFRGTPLEKNAVARDKLLTRLRSKGWEADSLFRTNGFSRARPSAEPFAAKDKPALVRALTEDLVPSDAKLDGVDLSGSTIADALIPFSLKKADLRNTTWLRCDFERTAMDGANLEGAAFEECMFNDAVMASSRAAGARFERCELRLNFTKADVRRATFAHNESSPNLDFTNANAQEMSLEIVTASESSLDVTLDGADLRGATIRVDITPTRRQELEKKPNARVKWAALDTGSANVDEHTTIEMAQLPGAKAPKPTAKKSAAKVDAAAIEHVGRIDATNAAMWFLAIDAKDAAQWKGEDPDEFDRALEIEEGPIDVGSTHGVLASMGDCAWAHVWRMPNGDILLVEHHRSGIYSKLPKEQQVAALRERVASFAVPKKSARVGALSVKCGVLALMLPYCNGDFTDEQLSAASVNKNGRLLLKVPDGDYEVSQYPFAPRGFEDELGSYGAATRIAKTTSSTVKR